MAKNVGNTPQMMMAAPNAPRFVPAFIVQPLAGKRKRNMFVFDAKGKKSIQEFEVDAGFLVRFSKGHSIRVADMKELERLGFDKTIPLVNPNDDDADPIGYIANPLFNRHTMEFPVEDQQGV